MLELVYPIYYFVSKHATVERQLSEQLIIQTSHKVADSAKMDTSKRKRTAPSVGQEAGNLQIIEDRGFQCFPFEGTGSWEFGNL